MKYTDVIIVKTCRGSEDGITVKIFTASDKPQPVEETLAAVFISEGIAKAPARSGVPGPTEKKIVTPDSKTVTPAVKKK